MLSHTTAPDGSRIYPEAQRVAVDDGIDTAGSPHTSHIADNMTLTHQPVVIVRAEEALILIMVLILWIAAIALFFNRWGKIRMLEPYQPKFIQQHRPSCPLVDAMAQQRSFSKFNLNGADAVMTQPHHFLNNHHYQQHMLRPRQNSVFVASSMVTLPMNPPRKVKSAFDLNNLVSSDPALNRSAMRLNNMLDRDELRRSSIIPEHMRRSTDSRNNSICSQTKNTAADNVDRLVPIKSGVLDFRRNSMLIINNLAEEISPLPFHRHCSLGGSNLNLTPDFPPSISPRRNSVIPPYAKSKPKTITNQKVSKSLDCERSSRMNGPCTNSTQSLSSVSEAGPAPSSDFPKIVETRCSTPPLPADSPRLQLSTSPPPLIVSTEDNSSCSSQINLLTNDQAYYYSQPTLDHGPAAATSLIGNEPINHHRLRHSAYKVTNV